MSNLVFNPTRKDYFQAKACVAIPMRYNYAGSYCSYRFKYLSFRNWSSSYRAAFCYVLQCLEDFVSRDKYEMLVYSDICSLFVSDDYFSDFHFCLENCMSTYFTYYFKNSSPVEKLSFVYKLLELLIKFNLGYLRFDLVSPMFAEKSAIRYAALKYFPNTSFVDIESDFMFQDVMD